jgi:hypothetical protein
MRVRPRGLIPTECQVCGVKLLNPHEITGLCRECKLVLRNERLSETNDTTGARA